MAHFHTFEEMAVWQRSRELTRRIRAICKRENVRRDYSFIDQITRSSRSIAANIAEGNDCMTGAEFISFLGYAKRSAAEVRSHLYDALDEQYISQAELDKLSEETRIIGRMIAKLIHHLQSLDHQLKRTYKESN